VDPSEVGYGQGYPFIERVNSEVSADGFFFARPYAATRASVCLIASIEAESSERGALRADAKKEGKAMSK